MATVREVLEGLKIDYYNGISISDVRHMPLGGGSVESVIKRFGDMEVVKSSIIEGHLRIYVKSNSN